MIVYQLVFCNTLRGESDCLNSAGLLAAMTQRIIRAERNEYGDLKIDILAASERLHELKHSASALR